METEEFSNPFRIEYWLSHYKGLEKPTKEQVEHAFAKVWDFINSEGDEEQYEEPYDPRKNNDW